MKARLLIAFVLAWCLNAGASTNVFHAQWVFTDFAQSPQAVRQVYLTPLWTVTSTGTTNFIAVGSQRTSKQTGGGGSLTVSNMIAGAYRVEFSGAYTLVTFTNVFGTNVTGLVNAGDPQYLSAAIPVNGSTVAYSQDATDALLAAKLAKTNGVAQTPTLNNPTNTGTTTFPGGSTVTAAGVFTGSGAGLTTIPESAVTSLAADLAAKLAATNGTAYTIVLVNATLLGTNTAIRHLSPIGGNDAFNDRFALAGKTTNAFGISVVPDQQGQIGIAYNGTLIAYLYVAGGTTTNSWTNGLGLPTGVIQYGDPSRMDPLIAGTVPMYFNGNPVNWNQTGDSFLELVNMSTNSGASGSGIVCARMGVVGGVPMIADHVALGFQLVPTNSLASLDAGYGLIPFNSGVLGFVIASPGVSGFDNGNYPYLAIQRSSGLVGFTKWVPGAYTPETNTFRWALKADPATGNITVTNGTMTVSNVTEPYADATWTISSTNITIGQSGAINRAPIAANRFNISYTAGDATGPCNPQFGFGIGGWYRDADGTFNLGFCNNTITTNIGVSRTAGGGANGGVRVQDNLRVGSSGLFAATGITLQVDGVLESTNSILDSVAAPPTVTGNQGSFWNSNKVCYWVTTTKTNQVSDGR
jgi:hypothetical protein